VKWAITIVLALLALTQYELHALNSSVSVLIRSRMEDTQIASARWRETNGVANSITTYREVLETEEEFIRRHMQSVREMTKAQGEDAQATREERR
jgi:hypothetical protein